MIETSDVDRFARQCLHHLSTESELMCDVIQSLASVRKSLLNSPGEQLAGVVENQQMLCQRVQDLATARRDMRARLARVLDVPESDATVGKLAQSVSAELRQRLLEVRQYLSQLAQEAEVLLRGNIALIRHNADILQQLAECITGQTAAPERYSATGKKEQQVHQSILQARF